MSHIRACRVKVANMSEHDESNLFLKTMKGYIVFSTFYARFG